MDSLNYLIFHTLSYIEHSCNFLEEQTIRKIQFLIVFISIHRDQENIQICEVVKLIKYRVYASSTHKNTQIHTNEYFCCQ